ncbi:MAG: hypothetical protein GY716_12535 [bacterium]|nr:hypothetical protein [bacterium]
MQIRCIAAWVTLLIATATGSAGAASLIEATFESAAPLTGLGPAATAGGWDPAGVEIGSGAPSVSDDPCDPPVPGLNSLSVESGPAGMSGTSQGLHLSDVNCGDARLSLAPIGAGGTSTDEYWIDLSFKLNAGASGLADSIGRIELFAGSQQVAKIWLGLWAPEGETPSFRYRFFIDPVVCGGCGLDDTSVDAFALGEATADDEWRVLIRIDPTAGTQTHRLWRNDSAIAKQDGGLPVFGTLHGLFQAQTVPLDELLVRTDYSRLSDLYVDEIRVTDAISRNFPVDLEARTAAAGIELSWSNLAAGEDGFTIERRVAGGPWSQVGTAPPGSTAFTDGGALGNETHTYRVAATFVGSSRSPWTNEAGSIPVYQNRPLHGWINVDPYVNDPVFHAQHCTTPEDLRHPIQCAINDLAVNEAGMASPNGPHVLYFPDDTYDVDRTLYIENKLGVQLIGESPGDVIIRWTGDSGTGLDDTRVLFHFEGGRDTTFRNLVWDGGCDDPVGEPESCFVVAFDESYCGTAGGGERTRECEALDWDESEDLGTGDVATAHFDSEFRNAHIGLRIGHYLVQDSEVTVRRCRFANNFVGASIEDQNALNEWFWDTRFEGNFVGITAYPGFIWKYEVDPNWQPGTCDEPTASSCFWSSDCPADESCRLSYCDVSTSTPCASSQDCPSGESCVPILRRGGDFQIFRGRFRDNVSADVWHTTGGHFIVKDSWSTGSGRFFYGMGATGATTSVLLVNNVVGDYDPQNRYNGRAVQNNNTGTILLLDNVFYRRAGQAGPPIHAATFLPTDVFALNNGFNFDPSVDVPYATNATTVAKVRAFGDHDVGCGAGCSVSIPAMPSSTEPLDGRPIYTVNGVTGEDIQAAIDVALTDPGPVRPIVHVPSLPGQVTQSDHYGITETLTLPAGSALDLVGDGGFTVLKWTGAGDGPILDVDAGGSYLTLRDLQLRLGGMLVDNVNQDDSAAFLSQVRVSSAGTVGIVADGLDRTKLDLVDLIVWSDRQERPLGLLVKSGDDPGALSTNPGTAVWTGSMNTNEIDFEVVNGPSGAKLLVTTTYMEHSHQYLRARGQGPAGQVEVHGSNMSTEARPNDPPDLGAGVPVVLAEDFPGHVAVTESDMFIQDFFVDCYPPAEDRDCTQQVERGVKIAQTGPAATTMTAIGNRHQYLDVDDEPDGTPEVPADADVSSSADYLRVSSKLSSRSGLPAESLPDLRIESGLLSYDLGQAQLEPLTATHLDAAFELLRSMPTPGFYDEAPPESVRVNFDRVFFWSPPTYGLVLTAGPACTGDGDCDDGVTCTVDTCDLSDLPSGVPGKCVFTPDDGSCDDDGDGTPNGNDCAPADGDVWTIPSPVLGLRLLASAPGDLTWSSPAAAGGTDLQYDVLRADSVSFDGPVVCVASGLTSRLAEDATTPDAPGELLHYLVRVRNACGENLGSSSAGVQRASPPCP